MLKRREGLVHAIMKYTHNDANGEREPVTFMHCHWLLPLAMVVIDTTVGAPILTNFNFNPTWISNYIHYKAWDEIAYPSPNFNGSTVENREWISKFIPYFAEYVIINPCWDYSYIILVKWAPDQLAVLESQIVPLTRTMKQSSIMLHIAPIYLWDTNKGQWDRWPKSYST